MFSGRDRGERRRDDGDRARAPRTAREGDSALCGVCASPASRLARMTAGDRSLARLPESGEDGSPRARPASVQRLRHRQLERGDGRVERLARLRSCRSSCRASCRAASRCASSSCIRTARRACSSGWWPTTPRPRTSSIVPVRVGDEPVARDQLRGDVAGVADRHRVGEGVGLRRRRTARAGSARPPDAETGLAIGDSRRRCRDPSPRAGSLESAP